MPCRPALQARQICLIARQTAGQVSYRHLAPPHVTSHAPSVACFATTFGLLVFDFLQRPNYAPSPYVLNARFGLRRGECFSDRVLTRTHCAAPCPFSELAICFLFALLSPGGKFSLTKAGERLAS